MHRVRYAFKKACQRQTERNTPTKLRFATTATPRRQRRALAGDKGLDDLPVDGDGVFQARLEIGAQGDGAFQHRIVGGADDERVGDLVVGD